MNAQAGGRGFALVELLVAAMIFLIVGGAALGLLDFGLARERSEQQQLDTLEEARVGLNQIAFDVHRSGYPPLNSFQAGVTVPANLYAVPFTGIVSGSINQTCTVNGGGTPCTIPGPYDLVLETQDGAGIDWIYYQVKTSSLNASTCTLYRTVTPKTVGGNPTSGQTAPLVEQIINTGAGTCSLTNGTPVFTYTCGGGALSCTPENISQVSIQLQAIPLHRDLQTGQVSAITLRTVARRINPPD